MRLNESLPKPVRLRLAVLRSSLILSKAVCKCDIVGTASLADLVKPLLILLRAPFRGELSFAKSLRSPEPLAALGPKCIEPLLSTCAW